ncbi:hypothetical protein BRW65_10880 [Mycobacterium paraffinicum]|uniref:DUF1772 domain-containing protein n=1 Tax=Mycobacterium paraffinicum TaxID=53378 RepID=A0A1Q4HVZ7_9MYCO|nr:anthrone oxygenase family protein [Mycobacterium paraffinicum]OJZ73872.1 hypothetical protein BRW65_10880 [Mycobacterium paraffinicum]
MAATIRRRNRLACLLGVAQLGHAHWLFGNIYEAVVKIPDRLASSPRSPLLGPGSPLRHYAPGAPITLATTAAAVGKGWEIDDARRWLAAAACCSIAGMAITGYLVRTVNLEVMFAATPPPPEERDARIRTWYRLNLVRIAAAAGALIAANRASQVIARPAAR